MRPLYLAKFFSLYLLSLLFSSLLANAQSLEVVPNWLTNFAGSSSGMLDASGTNAKFDLCTGISADTFGNFYVADFNNHRIRKITAAGVVTTLAGSTQGFANGTGAAAKFYNPTGVACDLTGNVYVADQWNNRIRKITPAGVVTNLAGSGNIGSLDGPADSATFNFPTGVACDLLGNVYVADQFNHKIRKITPAGVVSTFCGNGTVGFLNGSNFLSRFSAPTGVAADVAGNIYVADYNNNVIRKIDPTGFSSTFAGSGASGYLDTLALGARFNNPTGVTVGLNNEVFVTDRGNQRIRLITAAGTVVTYAGSGNWGQAGGSGPDAEFANPYSQALSRAGEVYVADASNHRIRRMTAPIPSILQTIRNVVSSSMNVTVSGKSLASNAVVRVPAAFEISLSPTGVYSDSLVFAPVSGSIFKTVYYRLKANPDAGSYSGNLTVSSTGATTLNYPVSGNVQCLAVSMGPTSVPDANVGFSYNSVFSQIGLTTPIWTVDSGALPPGIKLDTISGELSGMPTTIGLYNFRIKAREGICAQNKFYSINVTGVPLARWSYIPNTCSNRNVQFLDSSILAGTYLWDFGDGTNSNLASPMKVYAKDSVYRVTLTINGNQTSAPVFINVASDPVIPPLLAVPTCNFVYTINGAPQGYGYRYAWSFDAGSSGGPDTVQTPYRTYTFTGSTTVSLIISAQGKCSSVATPLVFNAQTFTTGVTAGLSVTAPGGNLCSNSRILTNTSTGSGIIFQYSLDGTAYLPITTPVTLNGLSSGPHQIRLAAHNGTCFDTAVQSFVVTNAVAAFVATPNSCNQTISFTNNSSADYGALTYAWSFGSPVKGSSTEVNPLFNYLTPGSDSATLVVTAVNGCSNTLKQSVMVGSGTGPTPGFNFAPSGVCQNKIQFTNTTTGTVVTYHWDFGDGTSSTATHPARAYADSGVFLVTLVATSPGCTLSIAKPVTISGGVYGPSAKFTVASPVQPITGNSFNYINESKHLGLGFNTKYYWAFGDGTFDSLVNSAYNKQYAAAGTYTVVLTAVSSRGCSDTYSQTVQVTQVLSAKFGYQVNTCLNRTVQFSDSSTLATSYLWNFGDGTTSTAVNPLHTYLRDSIYTVTLTVNGTVYVSKVITVVTTPAISAITPNSDCRNIYSFGGAPAGSNYSYLWTFSSGTGGSTTVQIPTRWYSSTTATTVALEVRSFGLCPASPPVLNFSPQSTAAGNVARLTLTAPGGDVCSSDRLLSNTSNTGAAYTYRVDSMAFLPIGSSISLSGLAAGFHQAWVTSTKGTCFDTAYQQFYISVPSPSFTSISSSCNQVVSFTNTSSSTDNGGMTFNWKFGVPVTGTSVDVDPSFNFGVPGNDTVSLTAVSTSGCSVTVKKRVSTGTGTSTLNAGFVSSLVPGLCQNKVQFTDTTSGAGSIAYNWDFGDGSTSYYRNPVKSYGGSGTYMVTLTTSVGNCFSTATHPVTISASAYGPSASFKVSNPVQYFPGNAFNFINDSKIFGGGWIQKWYWKFGDGTIDSVQNSFYAKHFNSADTFEVNLVVVSSVGCTDSTQRLIYVNPVPKSLFGYVPNTCANRLVQFVDSSQLATSWHWDFGDGDTSNLSSPAHNFRSDGIYLVKLTINGVYTTSDTLSIFSNPSGLISYQSNTCKNVFRFSSRDTGATYTYLWGFSAGAANALNLPNPVLTIDSNALLQVNLQIVSGGRCSTNIAPVFITAQQGTHAYGSITSLDYCGASRILTDTSKNSLSTWYSLDTLAFTPIALPVNLNNLRDGDHRLQMVSYNGTCYDTLTRFFNVAGLSGSFGYNAGNCDRKVAFNGSMQASDFGPVAYLWDFAGTGSSVVKDPLHVFPNGGKYKVTLTATAKSGCVYMFSDSVVVNNLNGPVSTFNVSEVRSTPCQSGHMFSSTSPDGVQFVWNFGDGQYTTASTSLTAFHAYTDTGFYKSTMIAINGNGCSTVSDTALIHVTYPAKPSPNARFTIADTSYCLSQQNFTCINASSMSGGGWISGFSWNFGDGTIDTVNGSVYGKQYSAVGVFNITLTAYTTLGCSSSFSRQVRVLPDTVCFPLGIADPVANISMKLYPNPNAGNFNIELGHFKTQQVSVRLRDMLGRIVYQEEKMAEPMMQISLPDGSGNYLLEVTTSQGVLRAPVLIVK